MKHRDDDTVRLSFVIGRNESGNYREFFVISVNGPCLLYISIHVVELLRCFSRFPLKVSFIFPSFVTAAWHVLVIDSTALLLKRNAMLSLSCSHWLPLLLSSGTVYYTVQGGSNSQVCR